MIVRLHKTGVIGAILLLSGSGFFGCGGGEDDSPVEQLQDPSVGSTADEEKRTVSCKETSISGTLRAGEEIVSLDGAELSLSTRHNDQCIGEVEFAVTTSDGCSRPS